MSEPVTLEEMQAIAKDTLERLFCARCGQTFLVDFKSIYKEFPIKMTTSKIIGLYFDILHAVNNIVNSCKCEDGESIMLIYDDNRNNSEFVQFYKSINLDTSFKSAVDITDLVKDILLIVASNACLAAIAPYLLPFGYQCIPPPI